MRQNNSYEMTVVEQIVQIRKEVCEYSCKYWEEVSRMYKQDATKKIMVQQHCRYCPLTRLNFERVKDD